MKHAKFYLFVITIVLVFPASFLAQSEDLPVKDKTKNSSKGKTTNQKRLPPNDSPATSEKSKSEQNSSNSNIDGAKKADDKVAENLTKKETSNDKGAENVTNKETSNVEDNDKNKSQANAEPPTISIPSSFEPFTAGNLTNRATSLPEPVFPEKAKKIKELWGAKVTVSVVIDENGKVISAKATQGPDSLKQAAENAAKQALFPKTIILGQPVQVIGSIYYEFKKP